MARTTGKTGRRAALIVARIKAGKDPIPEPMAVKLAEGPTVGELAEHYLEKHVAVRRRASSDRTSVAHLQFGGGSMTDPGDERKALPETS